MSRLRALLVTAITTSITTLSPFAVQAAALPSKVSGNVYSLVSPSYHANGSLAWYGLRQGVDYQSEFAFRHANGRLCWGGMKQINSDYNYVREGAFFWDNGKSVWGGYPQFYESYSYSSKAAFFHRNGKLCWGGAPQDRNAWHSDWNYDARMAFQHSNGRVAWGGLTQMELSDHSERAAVYHANGQLAWSGLQGSPVYDSYGSLITGCADFIHMTLGDGVALFVDYTGRFELTMALGEGYQMRVGRRSVHFDVFDMTMEVTP